MRKTLLSVLGLACLQAVPTPAHAATYTVGPAGRQYAQLSTLFDSVDLAPGDVVLVDGSAIYAGDIVMGDDDDGTASDPVTVRWRRGGGETRPVLSGGRSTIKFEQANHVVFEGFEITGGSFACLFSESHGLVVRDNVIHDCPSHGVLAADQNSGSLTFEYNEVYRAGSGTTRHSMYIQSDEVAHPRSVFRMQFNYVHDGNGGILMRTRHERSEIYYNWFEGSTNEEVEFVGPDCEAQKSGWTPDLAREDTDFVGNVVVHTSTWRDAIRAGGDLVGRSQGRVRMVNNTVLFPRGGTAVGVRVLLGVGSLEAHNNVFHQTGSGQFIALEEEFEPADPYCAPFGTDPWAAGRKVAGSNNWVKSGASEVPPEWTGTRSGADPLFQNVSGRDLRPASGSPLVDAGNPQPATPSGFPFPSPLPLPAFDPPLHAKAASGARVARTATGARIDIGALERPGTGRILRHGSRALLPPQARGGDAAATGLLSVPAAPSAGPPARARALVALRAFVWWRRHAYAWRGGWWQAFPPVLLVRAWSDALARP